MPFNTKNVGFMTCFLLSFSWEGWGEGRAKTTRPPLDMRLMYIYHNDDLHETEVILNLLNNLLFWSINIFKYILTMWTM